MLRKGVGSEGTKANLKRAPKRADHSRGAKTTAKETNVNYVVSRAAALPPMVELSATSDKSLQEQLHEVLKEHRVKLIDLFREWDDNGDGALDKKELRAAVAALGYEAPRSAVDTQDKQGNTAMHVAAMEQHEDACMALAEAGASIKVKNIDDEAVVDMLPERLLQRLGS